MVSVGRAIRIIRETKRVKLKDLAEAAAVSLPFLSLIEAERRQPSITVLMKLAEALRVPPEALMILTRPGTLRATSNHSEALAVLVNDLLAAEEALRRKLDVAEAEDSSESTDAR